MSENNALSVSVGILGAVSAYMTLAWWDLPVWVLFLAWASFFFVGSGLDGFVRSVVSNLAGVVIATVTLLVVDALGGGDILLAVAVGVGSLVMVQAPRIRWIGPAPAVVFGFAMMVGTSAVTGRSITTEGWDHPAVLAATTIVVGGLFGIASEVLSRVLQRQALTAS